MNFFCRIFFVVMFFHYSVLMAQVEPSGASPGDFKNRVAVFGQNNNDPGLLFFRMGGSGNGYMGSKSQWLFAGPRTATTGATSWEVSESLLLAYDGSPGSSYSARRFEFTPEGTFFIGKKDPGARKIVLQVDNLTDWNNGHYSGLGLTGTAGNANKEFVYRVSHTNGRHVFYGHTTELMRIQGDGNIGIGLTSNAGDRLHVNNGILRVAGTDVAANIPSGTGLRLGSNSNNYSWIQSTGAPLVLNPLAGTSSYVAIGFLPTDPAINLTGMSPDFKLLVNGSILCSELRVKLASAWPDYVFEPDYKLKTLREVEDYVTINKHLPDFPSAAEIEQNGIDSGEMNRLLVKKVEEMMLHLIRQEKLLSEQAREIEELKKQNK